MSGRELTAVIIGDSRYGAFGHWMDEAPLRADVSVVGVADFDVERAASVASYYEGQPRVSKDYSELLKSLRPDIVVLGPLSPRDRVAMFSACARSGVSGVYTEKPLARSAQEANEIAKICDAAGIRVIVDQWRGGPEVRAARGLIEDGLIGDLVVVQGHGKCDDRGGGGDLAYLGNHVIDAMAYLAASEVSSVTAQVLTDRRLAVAADGFEGPEGVGEVFGDTVHAVLTFRNGVAGTYESRRTPFQLPQGRNFLGCEVVGTQGRLSVRYRSLDFSPTPTWIAGAAECAWQPIALPAKWDRIDLHGYYGNVHEANMRELIAAVREGRPVGDGHPNADSAAHVQWVVDSIFRSHLTGTRVLAAGEAKNSGLFA